MTANEPLLKARQLALDPTATEAAIKEHLRTAAGHPLLLGNRQLAGLIERDLTADYLVEKANRSVTARSSMCRRGSLARRLSMLCRARSKPGNDSNSRYIPGVAPATSIDAAFRRSLAFASAALIASSSDLPCAVRPIAGAAGFVEFHGGLCGV